MTQNPKGKTFKCEPCYPRSYPCSKMSMREKHSKVIKFNLDNDNSFACPDKKKEGVHYQWKKFNFFNKILSRGYGELFVEYILTLYS